MNIYEDTNPHRLRDLLAQIHSREAALPDFQRDFVWDPTATQELIVSIASNFPAGSLLRIRNTHNLFQCRAIEGAPPLNGHRPTYLILDGQQRLTSLYQAFYGVGDHRYFLDLRSLAGGEQFENCIFHRRARDKRAKELQDEDRQACELILPLSVIFGKQGGFDAWRSMVRQLRQRLAMPEPGATREQMLERLEEVNRIDGVLGEIQQKWIAAIEDYLFPVVTLSDATSAEAVCTIFETLNRTGVKLSVFELLTARFWSKGVNLRQLWHETQNRPDWAIINDFDVDPYYLLQAIALVSLLPPNCRRGDVLNLAAENVRNWWDRVAGGMAEGLRLLRDECGVITRDWLPNYPMLVTLAAIYAKPGLPGGPQAATARQKLVRWFWCSVLGGKYESGPNSQAIKDYIELQRWLSGGDEPETVSLFRFDPRVLRETTFRQRMLYKALMCVILSQRPRDFHTAQPLTADLMIERRMDDHHIFPAAFLEATEPRVSARLRDCILNRTLIDRKTNQSISKRSPSSYLPTIREAVGSQFGPLMQSHLIPHQPGAPVWTDDFEAFLQARQELFWSKIQQLTGLTNPSDELVDMEEDAA